MGDSVGERKHEGCVWDVWMVVFAKESMRDVCGR